MYSDDTTKRCTKCGETKPRSDFIIDQRNKDGRGAFCKACDRVRCRVYGHAHLREQTAKELAWRAKNRDRFLERSRKTHAYQAVASRLRQSRKAGNPGKHTLAEWRALKAHYNYRCLCCGRCEPQIKLTADHIVPVSKGGSNDISNIQPLCTPCNSSKRDKTIDYR